MKKKSIESKLTIPVDKAEEKRLLNHVLGRKENSIQNAVMHYLRKQPGWWIKISDRFVAGIPDIIGCLNGKYCAIELKRPGGKGPTPLQHHNIEKIHHEGGHAIWATSLQEVKIYVELWKKEK